MFKLPDLGYGFDALEPHIDAKTMEIHHDKHHGAYVDKLNVAFEKYPDWQNREIEEVLSDIKSVPEDIRIAVQNNGGGHANHSLFWQIMKPGGAKEPTGRISDVINSQFGGFEKFKTQFTEAATNHFGSGWAWLVKKGDGFEVYSTANQDSPRMEGKMPIMGLDVWEHAYYLKYQNRRPEYIEAWWNVVNWETVAEQLNS
ncbi:MAG: superoxide dismutase [Candidatus Saccharimonadales bacterium]